MSFLDWKKPRSFTSASKLGSYTKWSNKLLLEKSLKETRTSSLVPLLRDFADNSVTLWTDFYRYTSLHAHCDSFDKNPVSSFWLCLVVNKRMNHIMIPPSKLCMHVIVRRVGLSVWFWPLQFTVLHLHRNFWFLQLWLALLAVINRNRGLRGRIPTWHHGACLCMVERGKVYWCDETCWSFWGQSDQGNEALRGSPTATAGGCSLNWGSWFWSQIRGRHN